MKRYRSVWAIALIAASIPLEAEAQQTAGPPSVPTPVQPPVPSEGSWGVSFNLPDGGGTGLGVRKMVSDRTNFGVDLTLDVDRRELENGAVSDERTSWIVGVNPDLRLYRSARGPVVPFIEVEARVQYGESNEDVSSFGAGAGLGLGVEWFPLDRMSISGSTGLDVDYTRADAPSDTSSNRTSVRFFRSELTLNLYFE